MNFVPDEIDFEAYLAETEHKTLVRKASDFDEDLKKSYRRKPGSNRVFLPWEKTMDNFDFRPGEVTLWAGQNGHGKSLITTQVFLSLLGQSQRVCVASLEMKPQDTLKRMLRMYGHMNPNSRDLEGDEAALEFDKVADEMLEWAKGLYFFNKFGNVSEKTILGMVRYCAKELKMQHIFIDNLQKCIRGTDDYSAEKDFVADLFAAAQDTQCHVHLVHHVRKPSKETDLPDKSDIKGAGSITDIVDNVFIVWRNKIKEDDIKAKGFTSKMQDEPDAMLLCRKQRHYDGNVDGEQSFRLWYNIESQQYMPEKGYPLQEFYCVWPHRRT